MNYDIRIMSREEIIKFAKRDILLRESLESSRAIFNDSLLDELKSLKTRRRFGDRIGFAKSSLEIMKSMFEMGGENTSLVYPVIMRIKEMLLIKCILEGKEYSLGLLEDSVRMKGISKSDFRKLLSNYRAVRDGKSPGKYRFGEHALRRLLELLEELIVDAEKKEKA